MDLESYQYFFLKTIKIHNFLNLFSMCNLIGNSWKKNNMKSKETSLLSWAKFTFTFMPMYFAILKAL